MTLLLILMLIALVVGMIVGGAYISLSQKITRLEQAQKHRLPYKVNDGLEDALAVLLELQSEQDYLSARMQQAHKILSVLRGDPDGYDSDAPNTKRRS